MPEKETSYQRDLRCGPRRHRREQVEYDGNVPFPLSLSSGSHDNVASGLAVAWMTTQARWGRRADVRCDDESPSLRLARRVIGQWFNRAGLLATLARSRRHRCDVRSLAALLRSVVPTNSRRWTYAAGARGTALELADTGLEIVTSVADAGGGGSARSARRDRLEIFKVRVAIVASMDRRAARWPNGGVLLPACPAGAHSSCRSGRVRNGLVVSNASASSAQAPRSASIAKCRASASRI